MLLFSYACSVNGIMNKSRTLKTFQTLLLILLAVTLSLIILEYANPQLYPPGRDGGAYMYGGRTVLHGQTLYVDYWEAKGPLIIFINAFGLLIGRDSRWGVWVVEVLFWVLAFLLGILTLKKQYGLTSALFSAVVMMMSGKILVGAGNFTEEYTLLFTWVAVFAFFKSLQKPGSKVYPILMGAMLALNFFVRANNIVTSGLLIALWLLSSLQKNGLKEMLRDAALVFSGGCIVAIPLCLYFLFQGTFIDMVNASIVYNYSYSFHTQPDAKNLNIIQSGFMPAFHQLGIWMIFPLIGFLFAFAQFIKQLVSKQFAMITLLLVLIWPAEMVASSISGRSYGHYFILWLPGMAILSAYGLNYIFSQVQHHFLIKPLPKWAPLGLLSVTLALTIVIFHPQLAQYGASLSRVIKNHGEDTVYLHPISAFITENTNPDDLILVWGGQTGMLFMSNRHSSTAYNFYPLYANSRLGKEIQHHYFEDLKNNKPKLILDAHIHAPDSLPSLDPASRAVQRLIYPIADNYHEVLDYINAHYHLILDQAGYQVYQLCEP